MLKKDLLELCLLHLLTQKDEYGYELLRELHRCFPDSQESALYALLRGLCKDGYTEQYQGEISGGPTRKYYRLTTNGLIRHEELMEKWREVKAALSSLGIE